MSGPRSTLARPGAHRLAISIAAAVLASAHAVRAQDIAPLARWEVAAPCASLSSPSEFVARVTALGGSIEGADVSVEVAPAPSGLVLGRARIARGETPVIEREIEDRRCADVLDALAITTALALRRGVGADGAGSGSVDPSPAAGSPGPVAVDSSPTPTSSDAAVTAVAGGSTEERVSAGSAPRDAAPAPASARGAVGASVRIGLGPTPGLALAPAIAGALEVDRLFVSLALAYWPDAAATAGEGAAGVAMYALTPALEIGFRAGDRFGVITSAVVESGVVIARGVGVSAPRTEVAPVLDAGLALTGYVDVDRFRLFVRAELLFAVMRPVYGIEDRIAHEAPEVRGTGGLGALVFLDP